MNALIGEGACRVLSRPDLRSSAGIAVGASPRPLVDPPEGWKFGFPKPIPDGVDRDAFLDNLNAWLVDNGYPQEEVDRYDGRVPCRIIGDL